MKKISGAYRLRTFVQLCLYLLAAVSILPAYSADAAKQKQSEEKKNGTLDAISSSFKQFGSKLGDSVSEIAADVKGIMYYSCNGTWKNDAGNPEKRQQVTVLVRKLYAFC